MDLPDEGADYTTASPPATGTLALWGEPFVHTRIPWLYNLRTDPHERASITQFPPRQKAAGFSVDQVLETLQQGMGK